MKHSRLRPAFDIWVFAGILSCVCVCVSTNSIIFLFLTHITFCKKKRKSRASIKSSKLLFSQRSAWRYVWGRTGEENNLSHPPHPVKESTSISLRFPYWLINCTAKYSALHYSSCRQDVHFAAKFQGQMGYRNVIEIKLVGWAVERAGQRPAYGTHNTHNRHHPPPQQKKKNTISFISLRNIRKQADKSMKGYNLHGAGSGIFDI